ncbi:MAG: DUF3842 family protein [Solirubrobacterales bacterium]
MKVAVVDGQGGGIGRLLVEKLRQEFGESISIIALGTNALAASGMMRAGANEGASGENAMVFSLRKADAIVGSVAILAANAFSGELTPRMAEAVASSDAVKVLLPINRSGIELVGVLDEPLPMQAEAVVNKLRRMIETKDMR